MARSPYGGLQKPQWSLHDLVGNVEHDLMQSLITEFTDVAGIEVLYYQRNPNASYDVLYGEDDSIGFESAKTTKVLYEVDQEPNIFNVFGMVGMDTIAVQMPQSTFYRDVSSTIEPKIGDVIHIKWNERNFEIAHVDYDDKIFQLKKFIWVFFLKPYRFSEQSDSASGITISDPISAYGDNEWIEEHSNIIDDYNDVDSGVYGY